MSTINKQLVTVDTSTIQPNELLDINSHAFIHNINKPVKRVSKIYISDVVLPNTFYNVNQDNVRLSLTTKFKNDLINGGIITETIIVENPTVRQILNEDITITTSELATVISDSTINTPDISTIINPTPITIPPSNVDVSYGTVKYNHFMLIYNYPSGDNLNFTTVLNLTQLSRDLGFISSAVLQPTFFSNSAIELETITEELNVGSSKPEIKITTTQNAIKIDSSNDLLIFKSVLTDSQSGVSKEILIQFPHTIYSINSIVYHINSELKRQSVDGYKCKYDTTTKKLIIPIDNKTEITFVPSWSSSQTNVPDKIFEVISTPLADQLKLTGQRSEFTIFGDISILPDTKYELLNKSRIHMFDQATGSNVSVIYKIPEKFYELDDLITELNTTSSNLGHSHSFSYDTSTKKITVSGALSILRTGLSNMIGLNNEEFFAGDYTFPKVPKIHTNQIYIKSRELFRISETEPTQDIYENTILRLPYLSSEKTKILYKDRYLAELFLSRKENISQFDILLTDDDNNIVNLNGGELTINFIFEQS